MTLRLALALLLVMPSSGGIAADPRIVSKYESDTACCGFAKLPPRLFPHSGVDFSGKFGDDVIAPADGVAMEHLGASPASCGNTIVLHHARFQRYTIYCHFKEVKVRPGMEVRRGDVIGTLGDSGVAGDCRRSVGACPIIHMELSTAFHSHPRAVPGVTYNVLDFTVGCFDPNKTYPSDRLALTYPVRCKD